MISKELFEQTAGRLLATFDSLEASGYGVSAGDEWCLSDALSVIPSDCKYTAFHAQDVDGLLQTGIIHVAYGATDEDGEPLPREELLNVGQEVQAALIAHGLHASWDGNTDHRICIAVKQEAER